MAVLLSAVLLLACGANCIVVGNVFGIRLTRFNYKAAMPIGKLRKAVSYGAQILLAVGAAPAANVVDCEALLGVLLGVNNQGVAGGSVVAAVGGAAS